VEKRSEELIPIFEAFMSDDSRWVRTSACSSLGPFIATFSKIPSDNQLVSYFCKLAADSVQTEYGDYDNHLFCAFNFPAVLLTIGAIRWPELSETYQKLANNQQKKVRKSIASSLHIIAGMVGEKISGEILAPIFEDYLRDFEEIKLQIIKNFAKFLKLLPSGKRKNYLYLLDEIQNTSGNWRFRNIIGKQIGDIAQVIDAQTTFTEIVPYFLALIQDPVAKIRETTWPQITKILDSLKPLPAKKKELIEKLSLFGNSDSFQHRIIFVKICGASSNHVDKDLFQNFFISKLLLLFKDKVPNIRIAVARSLQQILKNQSYSSDTRLIGALNTLKSDKDPEVIAIAKGTPSTTQKGIKVH